MSRIFYSRFAVLLPIILSCLVGIVAQLRVEAPLKTCEDGLHGFLAHQTGWDRKLIHCDRLIAEGSKRNDIDTILFGASYYNLFLEDHQASDILMSKAVRLGNEDAKFELINLLDMHPDLPNRCSRMKSLIFSFHPKHNWQRMHLADFRTDMEDICEGRQGL